LLAELQIPFKVITVLTAESLDYPDELFDFYQEHGIRSVGFNPEEVEGPHKASSLQGEDMTQRFRHFLARFCELALLADPPLEVREFETSAAALVHDGFVGFKGPDLRAFHQGLQTVGGDLTEQAGFVFEKRGNS
jgi:uncharacterized protein